MSNSDDGMIGGEFCGLVVELVAVILDMLSSSENSSWVKRTDAPSRL